MSTCCCKDTQRFLGSELPFRPAEECRYHIISVPYEDNVSYGGGTSRGPAAIVEASDQLEAWDGESVPGDDGIFTGPVVDCTGSAEAVLGRIERATDTALELGNCPVLLGGALAKNGSLSSTSSKAGIVVPLAAQAPSLSKGWPLSQVELAFFTTPV